MPLRFRSPLLALSFGLGLQAPALVELQAQELPAANSRIASFGYTMEDALPGLKFDQPLDVVSPPGDKERLFVVEKTGAIQVVTQLDGQPSKAVFLDLRERPDGKLETASECGALGLAFHPDYARNGTFFVYYSLKVDGKLHQRLSRFQVAEGDANRADPASEQILISQEDPAPNHNGGDVEFGPDGYLYITVGDGGAGNDAFDNARFINKGFFAAVLRIDVDRKQGSLPPNAHPAVHLNAQGQAAYAVPKDNPFIGATSHHGKTIDPATVRTEIWATGLRNPWRIAFEPKTGRLLTGDVGQNLYEEIDIIVKGGDYGWSYREGMHPFTLGPGKDQVPPQFDPVEPIFEYGRTVGLSVTGGVFAQEAEPDLAGAYIFADYATGLVAALREKDGKWVGEGLARDVGIAGLGYHPKSGQILFATLGQGLIKRLKKN